MTRHDRMGVASVLLVTLVGCSEQSTTQPTDDLNQLKAAVTGAAAMSIGPDGRFLLGQPSAEGPPIMDEAQARAAAEFAVRFHGPHIAPVLEGQHRGRIDFDSLRACGPVYFARSPFEPIPDGHIEELVYYLGPRWMVAVCGHDAVPSVSVSIAANAVAFRESGGQWTHPPNPVLFTGIPPEWAGALPVTPEGAVLFAAERSGARVSSVPILYVPNPIEEMPQGAYWTFEMDRAVGLQGLTPGGVRNTARLVVGSRNVVGNSMLRGPRTAFVVRPNARRTLEIQAPTRSGPSMPLTLFVRPEVSIDLEPATIIKGGGF